MFIKFLGKLYERQNYVDLKVGALRITDLRINLTLTNCMSCQLTSNLVSYLKNYYFDSACLLT